MGRTVLVFANTGFAGKETTSQRGGANRDLPLGVAVDGSEEELLSEEAISIRECFPTSDLIAHFNTRRPAGRKTSAGVQLSLTVLNDEKQ